MQQQSPLANLIAAQQTQVENIKLANKLSELINKKRVRAAWWKGVKAYALEILEWYINEASDKPLTEKTLLNGAYNWLHYSESAAGIAFVWNQDIAERLCGSTELKRVKNGEKAPNANEKWIDVQARAVYQAWLMIRSVMKEG